MVDNLNERVNCWADGCRKDGFGSPLDRACLSRWGLGDLLLHDGQYGRKHIQIFGINSKKL